CPAFGLRILEVVPGLQGDKAGMARGDVITRFAGVPVRGLTAFELSRGRSAGRMELWSPSRLPYVVDIQEGRIGISFTALWRPDLGYLRSPDRDPKWDLPVVVAGQ